MWRPLKLVCVLQVTAHICSHGNRHTVLWVAATIPHIVCEWWSQCWGVWCLWHHAGKLPLSGHWSLHPLHQILQPDRKMEGGFQHPARAEEGKLLFGFVKCIKIISKLLSDFTVTPSGLQPLTTQLWRCHLRSDGTRWHNHRLGSLWWTNWKGTEPTPEDMGRSV